MGAAPPTAHEASLLMGATMAVSMIGIFTGIFFLFISIDFTVRIAAAILVALWGSSVLSGTLSISSPTRSQWGGAAGA